MSEFDVQIGKWVEKVKGQEDEFVKGLSSKLIAELIRLTPHSQGTHKNAGRTKGNWRASRNRPPRKPTKATASKRKDLTGAKTLVAANRVINRAKEGEALYLVNRWYVAAIINKNPFGWRDPPIRMVDRTLSRADAFIQKTIREVRR